MNFLLSLAVLIIGAPLLSSKSEQISPIDLSEDNLKVIVESDFQTKDSVSDRKA